MNNEDVTNAIREYLKINCKEENMQNIAEDIEREKIEGFNKEFDKNFDCRKINQILESDNLNMIDLATINFIGLEPQIWRNILSILFSTKNIYKNIVRTLRYYSERTNYASKISFYFILVLLLKFLSAPTSLIKEFFSFSFFGTIAYVAGKKGENIREQEEKENKITSNDNHKVMKKIFDFIGIDSTKFTNIGIVFQDCTRDEVDELAKYNINYSILTNPMIENGKLINHVITQNQVKFVNKFMECESEFKFEEKRELFKCFNEYKNLSNFSDYERSLEGKENWAINSAVEKYRKDFVHQVFDFIKNQKSYSAKKKIDLKMFTLKAEEYIKSNTKFVSKESDGEFYFIYKDSDKIEDNIYQLLTDFSLPSISVVYIVINDGYPYKIPIYPHKMVAAAKILNSHYIFPNEIEYVIQSEISPENTLYDSYDYYETNKENYFQLYPENNNSNDYTEQSYNIWQ